MKVQVYKPDSSAVTKVMYRDDVSAMRVVFKNGSTVEYSDVPQSVFDELKAADSVGKYINANVRNKYDFKYVD